MTADPLPGDRFRQLEVQQAEGTFLVWLQIKDSQSGKVMPVTVPSHEVLAALILFCKHQGIPLARKAYKTLEVNGDQIAMLTTANFSYSRPMEKSGTIIYSDDDLEASKASLLIK